MKEANNWLRDEMKGQWETVPDVTAWCPRMLFTIWYNLPSSLYLLSWPIICFQFVLTYIYLDTLCHWLSYKEDTKRVECFNVSSVYRVFICYTVLFSYLFFVRDPWRRRFAEILDCSVFFVYNVLVSHSVILVPAHFRHSFSPFYKTWPHTSVDL